MQVDPRGQRFAAAVTTAVLALVLITGSAWLLAVQALVFAAAVAAGVRRSPYGLLYAWLIRPRLGPPAETEDPAPPRFAQAVGLVFALIGLLGYLAVGTWLGITATAFALLAAFLNAAFGLCLGCEMYLLMRRLTPVGRTP
ncbi:DUF4395 domain-containing protein [Streptomonospora sp. PA3]|uniref:DUF4395 domain-containing protein n=1 Tax=Streptomonospora sp. PA3 TaxID=2607326 RepID=UPI0012DC778B|nr:DUF4395 domain-containing protein [Streptomonospora sp. PA3]MUL43322.1 DUF4395 domain-containing protein [Streptomonospora sp. PA3]